MSVVQIQNVKKTFKQDNHQERLVLDGVNLTLSEGEVVSLLGTSGSGKSTLLRIIAGLVAPTDGSVLIEGSVVSGPVPGVGMVFQDFALFPWMTVLQNVELGLEALGMGAEERKHLAVEAIDMVGMDGFESAYPRELSGGMRQRVGIARALVVNPKVLLLDEPFSALDILTADNLRNDLQMLWQQKRTGMKAMLLVTHNIEEAAFFSDRIVLFGNNPGRIQETMTVDLPHPRGDKMVAIQTIMEEIYQKVARINDAERPRGQRFKTITLYYRIPRVEVDSMVGLAEALASEEFKKDSELSNLAEELYLDLDDLMPIIECLDILRFAVLEKGHVALTDLGIQFAKADVLVRKQIFAQQLQTHVPLVRHIVRVLKARSNGRVGGQRFLIELQDDLSEDAAQTVLKGVIAWGRYAELFAYDGNTDTLSFDDPE